MENGNIRGDERVVVELEREQRFQQLVERREKRERSHFVERGQQNRDLVKFGDGFGKPGDVA